MLLVVGTEQGLHRGRLFFFFFFFIIILFDRPYEAAEREILLDAGSHGRTGSSDLSMSGQPVACWAVCGVYQQRRCGRVG